MDKRSLCWPLRPRHDRLLQSGTWPFAGAACRGEHRPAQCRGGEPASRNQVLVPPATIAMLSGKMLASVPPFPIGEMGMMGVGLFEVPVN